MTYLRQIDTRVAIPRGLVGGHSVILKFGTNPDVDLAATEDVWDGGGIWVPPTVARIHEIASSDGNDTSAGTGAQTVQVQGLDASGDFQEEEITMNGVANVLTLSSYSMVHRMFVLTAGSGGENAGDITATAQTDATVTAQISAGFNQSQMAIYQVPTGKKGYIYAYSGSINKGSGAASASNILLFMKPSGGVFRLVHLMGLVQDGTSHMKHNFSWSIEVDAGSIIKIQASASANNTSISAEFDLLLVDD